MDHEGRKRDSSIKSAKRTQEIRREKEKKIETSS